jgi:hypothetical protein
MNAKHLQPIEVLLCVAETVAEGYQHSRWRQHALDMVAQMDRIGGNNAAGYLAMAIKASVVALSATEIEGNRKEIAESLTILIRAARAELVTTPPERPKLAVINPNWKGKGE